MPPPNQRRTVQLKTVRTKFATSDTRGELGRVNFRKDFWDCYQEQRKKIGQQLTGRSPVTIPESITGRISGPAPFSFLKWLLIFYLTWFRLARQNFIFQAIRKKKQISVHLHFFTLFSQFHRSCGATLKHKRALSQDVTVATLVFQNNETTAITVFQSNPAIFSL